MANIWTGSVDHHDVVYYRTFMIHTRHSGLNKSQETTLASDESLNA